jgi:hypothetical protein
MTTRCTFGLPDQQMNHIRYLLPGRGGGGRAVQKCREEQRTRNSLVLLETLADSYGTVHSWLEKLFGLIGVHVEWTGMSGVVHCLADLLKSHEARTGD